MFIQRMAILASLIFVLSSPKLVQAEPPQFTPTELKQLARTVLVDTAVPSSPAFTLLNVTPETVIRPRSPDEFATSILNNVDQNGNFQTGLAIDFTPAELFFAKDITLEAYRAEDGFLTRAFANTQLSVATAQGQEDKDKATRVALGFYSTPWIRKSDDIRRNDHHLECFTKATIEARGNVQHLIVAEKQKLEQKLIKEGKLQAGKRLAINSPEVRKIVQQFTNPVVSKLSNGCRDDWKAEHKSMSAWSIGFAPTWTSKDKDLDDLEWSGLSLWSSLSIGLGSMSKLPLMSGDGEAIFHLRYRADEIFADTSAPGGFFEQDTFLVSTKIRFDTDLGREGDNVRDLRYSIEGAYVSAERTGDVDDDYFTWSGKAEFRMPQLGENLWLDITAGRSSGKVGNDETFGGLNINWAFNDKSK